MSFPCPSAPLGLFSWFPLAHVFTVLGDLASTRSLRRLFDCLLSLFFGVSPLWRNLHNFLFKPIPIFLTPTLLHKQSMMPIFCWQMSISLVSYTSLPDWTIAVLPWICPGNNPMRSEIEEWEKRSFLENLRSARNHTNISRWVESTSTVTNSSYLFCVAQALKTEWSGKLGKNISNNFFFFCKLLLLCAFNRLN